MDYKKIHQDGLLIPVDILLHIAFKEILFMKQRRFFIVLVLVIVSILCACHSTLPNSEKSGTEYEVEFPTPDNTEEMENTEPEQPTTTALVESWDPQMFRKMRKMNLTKIDPFVELLANTIDQKDSYSFKNLWAPNVLANDIDESEIEGLFQFFEGSLISAEELGCSEYESKDGDIHYAEIDISGNVQTSDKTYRIALKVCIVDSVDINNVGIHSLYIIDAENTDMDFGYWGNHEWSPGITIDTEPFFPPRLFAETTPEESE